MQRTLAILEAVASRGGATAKEIADRTELPLPTVYRLARELLASEYLVHIRDGNRFELGYKLHQLAISLHEQIGVPPGVRAEVDALHQQLGLAAYFAIHRGSQIVVVFTADSPGSPRLRSIDFGFHQAPHATALGKIFLADLDPGKRAAYLDDGVGPTRRVTTTQLAQQLSLVVSRGVAWETGEWQAGSSCAAAAVRSSSGALLGSVAVSGPDARLIHGRGAVEAALRASTSRIGRIYAATAARPDCVTVSDSQQPRTSLAGRASAS